MNGQSRRERARILAQPATRRFRRVALSTKLLTPPPSPYSIKPCPMTRLNDRGLATMRIKRIVGAAFATACVAALGGCAGVTANVSGKCGSASGCDVNGSITFPIGKVQSRVLAAVPIDAAGVFLDTSGSTIAYPASGLVTLTLLNSNGAVVASNTFAWSNAGTGLVFANPSAVNAWESANSNGVSIFNYQLAPFNAGYPAGANTLAIATTYQGVTLASTRSVFTSPNGSNCRSCKQQ